VPRSAWIVVGASFLIAGFVAADPISGSGRVVDETRAVGEFVRIQVASGIQARIEAGPRSALALRGEDNVLPHVRTEVQGGTLRIGFEPKISVRTREPIQVALSVPSLDGLSASGGSRIDAATPSGDALALDASGGAHIRLAASVKPRQLAIQASGGAEISLDRASASALSISMSGSAVVSLAGRGDTVALEFSGGSELRAPKLTVGNLEVEGSGGGVATLHVTGSVHGSLSGGSQLHIGSQAAVDVHTSGGASVTAER